MFLGFMIFFSIAYYVCTYERRKWKGVESIDITLSFVSEMINYLILGILFIMVDMQNHNLACSFFLILFPAYCLYYEKKRSDSYVGRKFYRFIETYLFFFIAMMNGYGTLPILLLIMGLFCLMVKDAPNAKEEYVYILLLGIEALLYFCIKKAFFPNSVFTSIVWLIYMETGAKLIHSVVKTRLFAYVRKPGMRRIS